MLCQMIWKEMFQILNTHCGDTEELKWNKYSSL